MTLDRWLEKNPWGHGAVREKLAVCKDGFSVSIQDGPPHHCHHNGTDFEIYPDGLTDEEEEMLEDYADVFHETYGNVPKAMLEQILENHGGIVY